MRKILVTGGTVFVSRFIAEHYLAKADSGRPACDR